MQNIADELEQLLAEEAKRIYGEIYQMYTQQSGREQIFFDVIDSLVSKKLGCFRRDLHYRIIKLIPDHLLITNDARIFTTQDAYVAQIKENERRRLDELEAAGKTFAALIAQSLADQTLAADIFDIFGLLAVELSTADGRHLVQAIAEHLKQDHGLILQSLLPLSVQPC